MDFFSFLSTAVISLFIYRLWQKMSKIEEDLRSKGIQSIPTQISQEQNQLQQTYTVPASSTPLTSPIPNPYTQSQDIFAKFIEWLKEEWMLKLGAMLLLIGFGWLATYAFLNNWIGPIGRITVGIIAGALIMCLGYWRIKKFVYQGGVFLVLGSSTILLTVFAARTIYEFFTPPSALIIMFLSSSFVAFAGVKYNRKHLILVSLILACIAPILTNSADAEYIGLFSYLLVVTVGTLWVTTITLDRRLPLTALIFVSIYSLPYITLSIPADMGVLLIFAYVFSAIFFITNISQIIKATTESKIDKWDLITAGYTGIFLLTWIKTAAPQEWHSIIISAWMIVFAAGSFAIFKSTNKREPFYIYAGVSILMLASATAAELEGAVLNIAYTIESLIIVVLAHAVLKDIKTMIKLCFLFVVPIILSLESMTSRLWETGFINEDFFNLLILSISLLGLGFFLTTQPSTEHNEESLQLSKGMIVVGSIYLYILIWLTLHSIFMQNYLGTMISLVIYTLIGLVIYFIGIRSENKSYRLYGAILLGFVVGRLILIDVWGMELTGRIITFFLIGTLLISTAFYRNKNILIKKDS